MENFTLYIPCEQKYCHDRGLQKFHAVLDRPIKLEGAWEVALAEISFTKSVLKIKERQSVNFILPMTEKHSADYRIVNSRRFVEAGDYTLEELVGKINQISNYEWKPDINNKVIKPSYRDGSSKAYLIEAPHLTLEKNKVVLHCGKANQYNQNQLFFMYPSSILCDMLGLDREELLIDIKDICSKYKVGQRDSTELENIFNNYSIIEPKYHYKQYEYSDHFFVCSDICRPSIYGENYQHLLRDVNFAKLKPNSKTTIIYDNPYYVKLRKNPFQLVEIRLLKNLNSKSDVEATETEYDIKFGEIFLVLNFRKINDQNIEYETDPPLKKLVIKPKYRPRLFEVEVFDPEEGPPELPRPQLRP